MMRLDALIEGMGLRLEHGPAKAALTDLVEDSRRCVAGCAFFARSGGNADGRRFIADALQRGAAAIITDIAPPPADELPNDVAWVCADQADMHLAGRLGERFFGNPAQALQLIGITGTNGKTTTASLIHHLLNQANVPCGLIGTLGIKLAVDSQALAQTPGSDANELHTGLTTPGPIDFSRTLAVMRDRGCRAVATEVSSHALDQGRVAALQFNVGVFTNLTGDHLDYHGSMDAYAAAKARLFTQLSGAPNSWAVINTDDPYAEKMREAFTGTAGHVLGCTLQDDVTSLNRTETCPCRATILELTAGASRARFDGPWGSVEATLPLVGRHNIANALQAVAAASAVVDLSATLSHALASCPPVPGRLEKVPSARFPVTGEPCSIPETSSMNLPTVLVDYAHTHDALENVLTRTAAAGERQVAGGVRLWRRSRPHQAAEDGAGRLALRRSNMDHLRQPAQRRPAAHHR